MYSASAVDVATLVCFLDNQHIGLVPMSIIPPGFLSSKQPAKSESVYATSSPFPLYSILNSLVLLIYFRIFIILFQSDIDGFSHFLKAIFTAKAMSGLVHFERFIIEPIKLL